jgi:hypothetical protein
MVTRFKAGLLAITAPRTLLHLSLYTLALGILPFQARGAETITDGTTVRIRSTSIESGWHTGRIQRDGRSCSVVRLDRPTQHGYTSIALPVVDALQLGQTGAWTAVNTRRAIASEPAHCLADAAD